MRRHINNFGNRWIEGAFQHFSRFRSEALLKRLPADFYTQRRSGFGEVMITRLGVFQPPEDEDLRQRTPGQFSLSLDESGIDSDFIGDSFKDRFAFYLALVVKWTLEIPLFCRNNNSNLFLHYTRGVSTLQHFS